MSDDTKPAMMTKRCHACRHETEVPVPVCNLCGLSCELTRDPTGSGTVIAEGLLNCTVGGGYFSTPGNGDGALDDCTNYTFSLCEWCLDWLFSQCVVPPVVHSTIGDGPEVFEPAARRVANWLKHCGSPAPRQAEFLAELERRNVARGRR